MPRLIGKYQVLEGIGYGRSRPRTQVKRGIDTETGEEVALKLIERREMTAKNLTDVEREVDAMRRLDHANIIGLRDVMWSVKYPKKDGSSHREVMVLVLELASGGELFDFMFHTQCGFPEAIARAYFRQLISALVHIHGQGIAHRDLKPENLVLASDFTLKVTDLGLSALSVDESGAPLLLKTQCGTYGYMAPEVLAGHAYVGEAADVWGSAVILFLMLAGFPPFVIQKRPDEAVTTAVQNDWWLQRILHGQYKAFWDAHMRKASFSPEAIALMNKMLVADPSRRARLEDILADPWFCAEHEGAAVAPEVMMDHMLALSTKVDREKHAARERRRMERAAAAAASAPVVAPFRGGAHRGTSRSTSSSGHSAGTAGTAASGHSGHSGVSGLSGLSGFAGMGIGAGTAGHGGRVPVSEGKEGDTVVSGGAPGSSGYASYGAAGGTTVSSGTLGYVSAGSSSGISSASAHPVAAAAAGAVAFDPFSAAAAARYRSVRTAADRERDRTESDSGGEASPGANAGTGELKPVAPAVSALVARENSGSSGGGGDEDGKEGKAVPAPSSTSTSTSTSTSASRSSRHTRRRKPRPEPPMLPEERPMARYSQLLVEAEAGASEVMERLAQAFSRMCARYTMDTKEFKIRADVATPAGSVRLTVRVFSVPPREDAGPDARRRHVVDVKRRGADQFVFYGVYSGLVERLDDILVLDAEAIAAATMPAPAASAASSPAGAAKVPGFGAAAGPGAGGADAAEAEA